MRTGIRSLRMKRLVGCLPTSLGLVEATQDVTFVTSCADDSSAGTLRSILATAANNDVIDLSTQSGCSSITLTQGEIPIPVSVTLLGPAVGTFTVDGAHNGRVLHSTLVAPGYENLNIGNLVITGGRVCATGGSANGGCILSGNVNLQNSLVSDCVAGAAGGNIGGGPCAPTRYICGTHGLKTVRSMQRARTRLPLAAASVPIRSCIASTARSPATGRFHR